MMHVHRAPEPPSARISRSIPVQLEAIVLTCLAKDPEGRPQSADDLAERLAGVRTGDEWTADRAREWWDANRPMAPGLSPR